MDLPEIKVSYSTLNKEKIQIKRSCESNDVFRKIWDDALIEIQEEFKVVFLNRANMYLDIITFQKEG